MCVLPGIIGHFIAWCDVFIMASLPPKQKHQSNSTNMATLCLFSLCIDAVQYKFSQVEIMVLLCWYIVEYTIGTYISAIMATITGLQFIKSVKKHISA